MTIRKRLPVMLLFAALCGFCFRAGERGVQAAVPNPCPIGCKPVYGWWVNGALTGTQVYAVEMFGTPPGKAGPTTHTTHAIALYNVVPSPGGVSYTKNSIDKWIYPNSNATCGMMGGQWQTPQEVAPSGAGAFDSTITQAICQ